MILSIFAFFSEERAYAILVIGSLHLPLNQTPLRTGWFHLISSFPIPEGSLELIRLCVLPCILF